MSSRPVQTSLSAPSPSSHRCSFLLLHSFYNLPADKNTYSEAESGLHGRVFQQRTQVRTSRFCGVPLAIRTEYHGAEVRGAAVESAISIQFPATPAPLRAASPFFHSRFVNRKQGFTTCSVPHVWIYTTCISL